MRLWRREKWNCGGAMAFKRLSWRLPEGNREQRTYTWCHHWSFRFQRGAHDSLCFSEKSCDRFQFLLLRLESYCLSKKISDALRRWIWYLPNIDAKEWNQRSRIIVKKSVVLRIISDWCSPWFRVVEGLQCGCGSVEHRQLNWNLSACRGARFVLIIIVAAFGEKFVTKDCLH